MPVDFAVYLGAVAGAHVAPVALVVDEQVFLAQVNQGLSNRNIAMRMVLHGLPDNIGYFIKPAVIHFFHGMKNTALHRF